MKKADLTPPLGWPGGPCHLIQRIQQEVDDPRTEQHLVQEIEHGKELSNPEAAKVYDLEHEQGAGGPFRQVTLGPHTQYRMDLRSVLVPQVRMALRSFLKAYFDGKSQDSSDFRMWENSLRRGEPINWTDPRLGLTVVFVTDGPGRVKLVTTYWKGDPDPRMTPGECAVRHHAGYQAPAGDLAGVKTFVKNPDGTMPTDHEKQQVLPSPPWSKTHPAGPTYYNGPGSSGEGPDGRSVHKDMVRTPSKPGDTPETDFPSRTTPTRRREVMGDDVVEGAMKGKQYPGADRQQEQRGQAKRWFQRYYQKNRGKIRAKMRKWHKKFDARPSMKRDKSRREKYPDRFDRWPGGYSTIKERSKDQREEKKASTPLAIPIVRLTDGQEALLLDVSPEGTFRLDFGGGVVKEVFGQEVFQTYTLVEEADIDRLMNYLDQVLEYNPDEMALSDVPEEGDDESLDDLYFGKSADMIERDPPDYPPENHFDRAKSLRWERGDPLPGIDQGVVYDNPGSAKVIPNNKDFVNNTDWKMSKSAVRMSEIEAGCSRRLHQLSNRLKPKLLRTDIKNMVWLFAVPGSKGQVYRVRVKAIPKGNTLMLSKMDVRVSCSCPYWQWQGPEYWASTEDYLYGKPRGTASLPEVKDPKGKHRGCKHLLAVFKAMAEYGLIRQRSKYPVMQPKTASDLWTAFLDGLDIVAGTERVAARYLEQVLKGE